MFLSSNFYLCFTCDISACNVRYTYPNGDNIAYLILKEPNEFKRAKIILQSSKFRITKIQIFWDVAPFRVVCSYWCFGWIFCFHNYGRWRTRKKMVRKETKDRHRDLKLSNSVTTVYVKWKKSQLIPSWPCAVILAFVAILRLQKTR
jgi:hypothetical protein